MTVDLQFRCEACQSVVAAPVSCVGVEVTCPACEALVRVPKPEVVPGMTIGSFRLDEEVNNNGLGRLFLATQVSMDRQVVVKIMEPELFAERDVSQALLSRLRALAQIEHAGVNRYLDSRLHQGLLAIAMPYVEGFSVARHLQEEDPLDEVEAVDVAREVAVSLMEVYERCGELHGDLKPANLIMTEEGDVRLLNFGLLLASQLPLPERPESLHGSIYYASPERLRQESHLDWRADLYSLGVILFHMLTGGVPYAADTAAEVAVQHLHGHVPRVRDFDPMISRHTDSLIYKMMAPDRDERHCSWREAIIDMEYLLAGEKPPSVVMRRRLKPSAVVPKKATRPWLALALATGLLITALVLWYLLMLD